MYEGVGIGCFVVWVVSVEYLEYSCRTGQNNSFE